MTAKGLREKYLKFFEGKGHKVIPSAPLVPENDPTALFTTAGMHPLVPFLLGLEHPAGQRLVNVQKCLRTDDIEEVGDNWHNTFFEMLGNWSLGDLDSKGSAGTGGGYGKKEAIGWSYEFITKELKISPDKLWVTVFAGDNDAPKDEESVEIWKSLGIVEERIVPLPKKDNWWGPVGETGPCGPDTEMFVDTTGKSHGSDCQLGDSCGRFSEIWNDVFMEYDRQKDGTYKPLKQKNVDTGMGIERTTAVLQGKSNIYETELFAGAIDLIRKNSKKEDKQAERIVADHLRAATFVSAEGILPSNKDQGYVLRRLIRGAVTKAKYSLELEKIMPVVEWFVLNYKDFYPELGDSEQRIKEMISNEISVYLVHSSSEKTNQIEEKEYKAAIENPQTYISTATTTISGGKTIPYEELQKRFDLPSTPTVSGAIGTASTVLKTTFGIPIEESLPHGRKLLEEWKPDQPLIDLEVGSFLNAMTELHKDVSREGMEKKFAGGLADHSDITVRGHTATHLLHQALRDILGDHVHQSGSNITPERIRFDFSHPEKLTEEQVKKVEEIVNQKIQDDLQVKKELMSQEEADKKGAIGLFKEKYGDKVSIYEIGDYSVEYCGGPHVEHTSQVGKFEIVKEESLAAGQRRIRAVLN